MYGGESDIQLNTNDAKAMYEPVMDDENTNLVCYLFPFISNLNVCIYPREWHTKFPKMSALLLTAVFVMK